MKKKITLSACFLSVYFSTACSCSCCCLAFVHKNEISTQFKSIQSICAITVRTFLNGVNILILFHTQIGYIDVVRV